MFRSISALVLLTAGSVTAAAGPGADIVDLDVEAYASPFDPAFGASVHYEHRFADSQFGVTLRGGARLGEALLDDERGFTDMFALIGLREHWGPLHFEAALGVGGGRDAAHLDDDGNPVPASWGIGPDFELEVGRRFGPVEISLYSAILGLGLRVGLPFDV